MHACVSAKWDSWISCQVWSAGAQVWCDMDMLMGCLVFTPGSGPGSYLTSHKCEDLRELGNERPQAMVECCIYMHFINVASAFHQASRMIISAWI